MELIDSFVADLRKKRTYRIEKILNMFFKIFYMITQHAEQYCNTYEIKGASSNIDYTSFLRCRNIYQVSELIHQVVLKMIETPVSNKEYYIEIVNKAKAYINEHLAEDISLHSVSLVVNISPCHFSKIFKDVAGINFIDYCIIERIEKVKFYINSGQKLYIASEKVGYSNYSYFSRLFKKVTGLSPEEYKKRNN